MSLIMKCDNCGKTILVDRDLDGTPNSDKLGELGWMEGPTMDWPNIVDVCSAACAQEWDQKAGREPRPHDLDHTITGGTNW